MRLEICIDGGAGVVYGVALDIGRVNIELRVAIPEGGMGEVINPSHGELRCREAS